MQAQAADQTSAPLNTLVVGTVETNHAQAPIYATRAGETFSDSLPLQYIPVYSPTNIHYDADRSVLTFRLLEDGLERGRESVRRFFEARSPGLRIDPTAIPLQPIPIQKIRITLSAGDESVDAHVAEGGLKSIAIPVKVPADRALLRAELEAFGRNGTGAVNLGFRLEYQLRGLRIVRATATSVQRAVIQGFERVGGSAGRDLAVTREGRKRLESAIAGEVLVVVEADGPPEDVAFVRQMIADNVAAILEQALKRPTTLEDCLRALDDASVWNTETGRLELEPDVRQKLTTELQTSDAFSDWWDRTDNRFQEVRNNLDTVEKFHQAMKGAIDTGGSADASVMGLFGGSASAHYKKDWDNLTVEEQRLVRENFERITRDTRDAGTRKADRWREFTGEDFRRGVVPKRLAVEIAKDVAISNLIQIRAVVVRAGGLIEGVTQYTMQLTDQPLEDGWDRRMDERAALRSVPVGGVVAYFGPLNRLPPGWQLCDGSELRADADASLRASLKGGRVPDLLGRFLRGSSNHSEVIGDVDGVVSIETNVSQSDPHTHRIDGHSHALPATTGSISNSGGNPGNHRYLVRDNVSGNQWENDHLAVDSGPGDEGQHRHDLGGQTDARNLSANPNGVHNHRLNLELSNLPPHVTTLYIMRIK